MERFTLKNKRTTRYRTGIALISIMFFMVFISISCAASIPPDDYYRSQIAQRSHPYQFSYVDYELDQIADSLHSGETRIEGPDFKDVLSKQITDTLTEQGISAFPPPSVNIEEPPHLLVVSPRDRIFYFDRVVLEQEMNVDEQEYLESIIDELGFSSLVVPLGGFGGIYPPVVTDNADIKFIIDATVEEWLHQYLVLKPLGFRYLLDSLGIIRDPDIVTINETAVGIISQEIGDQIYDRYYKNAFPKNKDESGFDFDAEMRETRRQVDLLLESGQVDEAESYMEARRQYFVENGYNIRKLNQAYFAFHGIYGYGPAAVSPIYGELEELRAKSGSIREFLDTVASFRSYDDLKNSLE
jgi:hypothetical protein